MIDAVWESRQPEDYDDHNLKKMEFLRSWLHDRNHPHLSMEVLMKEGFDTEDPAQAFDDGEGVEA